MAEQLALDQVVGDRSAIDRDKRLIGARRDLVNKLGRRLLADAALAGNQQRAVDICDPPDQHFHLAHRIRDTEIANGSGLEPHRPRDVLEQIGQRVGLDMQSTAVWLEHLLEIRLR